MKVLLFLAFCFAVVNGGFLGTVQTVSAKGRLACGTKSVADVKIELWEEDKAGPDDLLNATQSDSRGNFMVTGQEKEIASIQPYLIIKHNCDNGVLNEKCKISDEYPIPEHKIGSTYDMGIVSLNIARRNHKKKCK